MPRRKRERIGIGIGSEESERDLRDGRRLKLENGRFTLKYFENHFGLLSKGYEVCISSAHGFVKIDLVKSTSKSVFGDQLDMANFNISRVKFEILHWFIVKVLYRNPRNWGKVDDQDLYLIWILLNKICFNWFKFILQRVKNFRTSSNISLFFSSFIWIILELNDITSTDEELVKVLKLIDSTTISLMRWYKYKNNE
ncbi:unnamed protein product [Vicia faba]|uniref:Uncharacterized protein n=1 Tax=Vicia faba TaxID=3906 RepID=A0AAV1AKA8_VICFA|nr:unnamed protein product [Vicia faba]